MMHCSACCGCCTRNRMAPPLDLPVCFTSPLYLHIILFSLLLRRRPDHPRKIKRTTENSRGHRPLSHSVTRNDNVSVTVVWIRCVRRGAIENIRTTHQHKFYFEISWGTGTTGHTIIGIPNYYNPYRRLC